jgi:hypothetical protein
MQIRLFLFCIISEFRNFVSIGLSPQILLIACIKILPLDGATITRAKDPLDGTVRIVLTYQPNASAGVLERNQCLFHYYFLHYFLNRSINPILIIRSDQLDDNRIYVY